MEISESACHEAWDLFPEETGRTRADHMRMTIWFYRMLWFPWHGNIPLHKEAVRIKIPEASWYFQFLPVHGK